MASAQYIGKPVSLITHQQLRFEGILENLDMKSAEINLRDGAICLHNFLSREP
jgi:hypothetical protein